MLGFYQEMWWSKVCKLQRADVAPEKCSCWGSYCIFDNCTKKFNNNNSLRSHFTLKHIKLNQCDLKSVNKIDNIRLEVSSDQSSTIEDLDDIEVEETVIEGKEDEEAEINITEEEDHSFEVEDEQFFQMSTDFLISTLSPIQQCRS